MENNKQQIQNINNWAITNPDKIFEDNFREQRKYLTNDTWNTIYPKLNIKFGDKRMKMVPIHIQSKIFNEGINTAQNKAGNTIYNIGKGVASIINPTAGLVLAGSDLLATNAIKNVSREQKINALINAGLEVLPFSIKSVRQLAKNSRNIIKRTAASLDDTSFTKEDFSFMPRGDIFYNKYIKIKDSIKKGKPISESDKSILNHIKNRIENNKKYPEIPYEGKYERQRLIDNITSKESKDRYRKAGWSEEQINDFLNNQIYAINNTPIKTTSTNNKALMDRNAKAITYTTGVDNYGKNKSKILVGENILIPYDLQKDNTMHELLHAADFYDDAAIRYNKNIPLKVSKNYTSEIIQNGKPYILDDIESRTRALGAREYMKESGRTAKELFNNENWKTIPGYNARAMDFFRLYDKDTGINFLNNALGITPIGIGIVSGKKQLQ